MTAAVRSLIEFLADRGARDIGHIGNQQLIDHLIGTMNILDGWGMDRSVCLAGLFHSAYGTESFEANLLSADLRPQLRTLIGASAERLVFLFCEMDREHFLGQMSRAAGPSRLRRRSDGMSSEVSREEFVSLCHLYVANRLEQYPRWSEAGRSADCGSMLRIEPFLCPAARRDLSAECGRVSRSRDR